MTSTTPPAAHAPAVAYPFQLARFNVAPVVQDADGIDPNVFGANGGIGCDDTSFVFPSSHYVQSSTSEYGAPQPQHLAASQLFSAGFLPLGRTTGGATLHPDQTSVESLSHESLPGVPHVVEQQHDKLGQVGCAAAVLVPSPSELVVAGHQSTTQHAITDGEVASSPQPPPPPTGDAAISALGGVPTRNGAVRTAPSGRSLFVSKLDPAVDYIALHQLFAPFGRIVSTRVLFDQISAQSRCIGYVNFADPADAARAVEGLNARAVPPVQKHPLVVKLADEDSSFTAEETNKIFAKNLPVTATLADVRSLFEKFGKLLSATVHRDTLADPASLHCLMAYVTFEQVEGAVNAVAACHNRVLFANSSQPLIVKLAETISSRERRLGPKSSSRGTPVAKSSSATPTHKPESTTTTIAAYPSAVPTTHIQPHQPLLAYPQVFQPQAGMTFAPSAPFAFPAAGQQPQHAMVGMQGSHQVVYAMPPPQMVVDPQLRQHQPLILLQNPMQMTQPLGPAQQQQQFLAAASPAGPYGLPVFQMPFPQQYPGQPVAMMPPAASTGGAMLGPMSSPAAVSGPQMHHHPNHHHQPAAAYPIMLHTPQQQQHTAVGVPQQFALQYAAGGNVGTPTAPMGIQYASQ